MHLPALHMQVIKDTPASLLSSSPSIISSLPSQSSASSQQVAHDNIAQSATIARDTSL